MTVKELKEKLIAAYSSENLNRISVTLINLYRERQFAVLRRIAEVIEDHVSITIDSEGKGFSGFMMLYHPDRSKYHLDEIRKIAERNDYETLLTYSHILLLSHIDEISETLESEEDIDYSPVYEWSFNDESFTVVDEEMREVQSREVTRNYTFIEAVRLRFLGDLDAGFPSWYLEDIEEYELASSDIYDLEGVEFCIHAKTIDLSDNGIYDISPLAGLSLVEELNLADNELRDISPLSNLLNLRSLDLSNNSIDDISDLFSLPRLETLSLEGNPVPLSQIEEMTGQGVDISF